MFSSELVAIAPTCDEEQSKSCGDRTNSPLEIRLDVFRLLVRIGNWLPVDEEQMQHLKSILQAPLMKHNQKIASEIDHFHFKLADEQSDKPATLSKKYTRCRSTQRL